jgi:hypothetical protein
LVGNAAPACLPAGKGQLAAGAHLHPRQRQHRAHHCAAAAGALRIIGQGDIDTDQRKRGIGGGESCHCVHARKADGRQGHEVDLARDAAQVMAGVLGGTGQVIGAAEASDLQGEHIHGIARAQGCSEVQLKGRKAAQVAAHGLAIEEHCGIGGHAIAAQLGAQPRPPRRR